jgi:hypothetical protein
MTKTLAAHSMPRAMGVRLDVQAWRQLAIGIAIKKFSQQSSRQSYQLDLELLEKNVTPHPRAALSGLYSNTPPKPLNGGRGF